MEEDKRSVFQLVTELVVRSPNKRRISHGSDRCKCCSANSGLSKEDGHKLAYFRGIAK